MSRLSTVLLFAAIAATFASSAQPPIRRQLIYARIEGNAGTVTGPHVGIAAVVRERHELGLAGAMYLQRVRNVPADLDCGCHHGIGNDGIAGFSATYAYLHYPGRTQRFWRIALRGGIVAGAQRRTFNFSPIANPLPYDANYDWEEERSLGVGLVLRPTIDLAVSRVFGLSAGPYAMLSKDFFGAGVSFGVMLGRVSRDGAHQRAVAWKERVRGRKAASAD